MPVGSTANGRQRRPRPDPYHGIEALWERVDGQGDDIHALTRRLDTVGLELGRRIDATSSEIKAKLDERSRTPWAQIWAALGVLIAFGSVLGGVAYLPIKSQQDWLALQLSQLRSEEQTQTDKLVPREEHQVWWKSFEVQHADLKAAVSAGQANLQRQIDELRAEVNSVYTPHDEVASMQRQIESLEGAIMRLQAKPGKE